MRAASLLVVLLLAPQAEGPPRAAGTLSDGGTDRGSLEIALGTVTLAAAVGLVVYGSIEIVRGVDLDRACSGQEPILEGGGERDCAYSPPFVESPRFHFASAGLSYGFAVPLTIAAGFLLRKGIRIRRDHAAFHRAHAELRFTPAFVPTRAGFGVDLRF